MELDAARSSRHARRGAPVSVIFPFTTWGVGGSHLAAFELAQALEADGGAQCLVLAPEGSPIAAEAVRRGLKAAVSGEPPLIYNKLDLAEAPRVARRAAWLRRERRRNTIVHSNDFRTLVGWAVAAKAGGATLVHHHRGLQRFTAMKRMVFARPDHVISISDACSDNVAFLPERRRTQVTDPVTIETAEDPAAARAAFRAEFGIDADAKVVGVMANFWARKRPVFFLEAAARLAALEPTAQFVLFGRDADHSAVELEGRAAELGIAERTRFPGFQSDIARNFAGIDLLAAPPMDEPFGRTPVEAMLHRVPYVAAESAGHVEIHRRWGGGRLMPPDATPQEWADALAAVLRRPEEVRLTDAARARLKADVAPARHAAGVLDVYRRVLNDKPRSGALR